MKVKKEYSILVAIMVALVLYLVLRDQERTHYRLPKLPNVAGTEISKVEISKGDTSTVLMKKDNNWYIDPKGYPADSRKIRDMLATLETLTLTALVSESKNYSRYDLSSDKKIAVKAWEGNEVRREFDVGKAAPSYRHTFVKLAGDDRVYHAQGHLRGKFDQSVENLWDRTVLSFQLTEIQEFQITKGGQSMRFDRKQLHAEVTDGPKVEAEETPPPKPEIAWQTVDGKKGDESKVNRLLAALSNLRCEKYIEDRKKGDFTDPIYTITLKGAEEYVLSIFAKPGKEAKHYPAISSQSDFPFSLNDRQADKIMANPDHMLEKPEKS